MVNEFATLVNYCPTYCVAEGASPFYKITGNPIIFYIFELANFAVLAFLVDMQS